MRKIIVVNNPTKWGFDITGVDVVSARDYIENPKFARLSNVRVFNLCNDYAYLTRGYYVSLLAEARGQKVIPSVKHIIDLKVQPVVKVVSEELEDLIQRSLKHVTTREFTLSIYFGKNVAPQFNELAHEMQKLFQAPLLRVKFEYDSKWVVRSIKAIPMKEIPEHHLSYVRDFANEYFSQSRYDCGKPEHYKYDLAILIDPAEQEPPSNKKAIAKFVKIAEKLGCYVELLTKNDYGRLREFDMLFIRTTTSVNHYTYRFARRAQSEGLAVIDDPESILKCANKVYLAEMLQTAHIATPKSIIVGSVNDRNIKAEIGFPCVLKLPDSSFSMGVKKASNDEELKLKMGEMLRHTDLLVVQEFMPTDYDWRVGVLGGEVVFVCRYYMAAGHWQIYNWDTKVEDDRVGNFDNVPLNEVPREVIETAVKTTKLIGDGLYGVDVKFINGKAIIIEINDNPNIDFDIEDQLAKDSLYEKVIMHLINKVKADQAFPDNQHEA